MTLTHLHNHFFSHDSMGEINRTVQKLASQGFKSLAITDHGTLRGVIAFTNACETNGIKPILGNEVYIEYNDKTHHLTLLAKNQAGYSNLVKLNNIAKIKHSKRTEQNITFDDLFKHKEGIIVLSGCPASPFQTSVYNDSLKQLVAETKFHFGEDFYLEAQFLFDLNHYNRILQIKQDFPDLKILVTNDCHYQSKLNAKMHYDYCKATTNHAYDSSLNYFITEEELIQRVEKLDKTIPIRDYIATTDEVDQKCELIKLKHKPELPKIENAEQEIERLAWVGLTEKGLQNDPQYSERLKTELEVIIKSGYSSYFLITKDLIDVCKANSIEVGPGRGSAAGSLASYCLGITNIDPIKYDLMFERFLNPLRLEMPDIDTDISSKGRQAVIDYANQKYGALQIAAYDTWGIKSILNKFGKHYRVDSDVLKEANELEEITPALQEASKELCEIIEVIDGSVKGISRHAGGVAILPEGLEVPYETAPDKTLILAFSEGGNSKDLQYAGAVKFDLLGLKALDILEELKTTLKVEPPEPETDNAPIELFQKGKTTGIFQFTSAGNIKFTMQVQPRNFEDLVAINALYRKGTLLGGTADAYLSARFGRQREIHPELDQILSKTSGALVYQEDVMKLYAWACDKSFGQADFARKTLVKYKAGVPEKEQALLELQKELMQGFKNKGLSDQLASKLWEEIKAHSLYSFNRSHAVAYAKIAYDMAWYKFYYPLHFFTAGLNNRPEEEKQEFVFEILSEGYEIVMPKINISSNQFETDGTKMFMPLSSVHGIGQTVVEYILEERQNGLFQSCEDLVRRIPRRKLNAKTLQALYHCGALDEFSDFEFLKINDLTKLTDLEINRKYFKTTQIATPEIIKRVNYYNSRAQGFGGCVTEIKPYTTKTGKAKWRYILAPNQAINSDKELFKEYQWIVGTMNDYRTVQTWEIL